MNLEAHDCRAPGRAALAVEQFCGPSSPLPGRTEAGAPGMGLSAGKMWAFAPLAATAAQIGAECGLFARERNELPLNNRAVTKGNMVVILLFMTVSPVVPAVLTIGVNRGGAGVSIGLDRYSFNTFGQ